MLTYLLQVSCIIALVYGLYYWSLKRMTHHALTRSFLLVGLFGSWVLPQVSSYLAQTEPITAVQTYLPAVYGPTIDLSQMQLADPSWGWQEWAWLAYGAVCLLMLVRLLAGIGRIGMLYTKGIRLHTWNDIKVPFCLIVNPKVRSPFSFFNSVFISPSDLNQRPKLVDRLLEHEQVHVQRWHSLDLLLIELTRCVLWWHPILPAYKRAVRQSHEFEADAIVLRQRSAEKQSYGRQLLNRLDNPTRRLEDQLANQFYHSFISKRLQMMNTIPTSPKLRWKYALIVPILFAGMILFAGSSSDYFASTNENPLFHDTLPPNTSDRPIYNVVDQMPSFPIAEEIEGDEERKRASERAMLEYIYTEIRYPGEARRAGVEGMAVISFIVETDGSISDVAIARDPGEGLGEEAKRVVSKMIEDDIRWTPGMQGNEAVRFKFNMPIRFKLQGDEQLETTSNMEEGESAPENSVHVIGHGVEQTESTSTATNQEIFRIVEQMPLFPGGEGATYQERKPNAERKMLEYIYGNIKYPKAAVDADAEGMAVVSFVVEKDGTLSEVAIRRDPGHGMGAEAMRVVEAMNDDNLVWEPGMQAGELVRVQFNLPIRFKLTDDTDVEEAGEETRVVFRTDDDNIVLVEPNGDGPFNAEFFINGEYAGEVGDSESVINEIDPNDIESISVIKEASEVALMRQNPETQGIILIQLKDDSNRSDRRSI
ncbi:MAG: TonB family protein, partial [Bacteroidota bacterium]